MRLRTMGLLALVAVGSCGREPTAPDQSHNDLLPAAAFQGPDADYVPTPAGWYHRSCIHPVPQGAHVDA